jgi:hypothetical protein
MASKLLLRILTAARPGIRQGVLKMQDVVQEYFKQSGGKTIDAGDRAIIENEFIEFAPSNVTTPDVFKGFLDEGDIVNKPSTTPGRTVADDLAEAEGVETAETILPTGNVEDITQIIRERDHPFTAKVAKKYGIKLRGDESFAEIQEILDNIPTNKGIGSMIPKEYHGYNFDRKTGEYTKIPSPVKWDDIIYADRPIDKRYGPKNWSQRDKYAKFIRKMRDKDFKNPDIRKIVTESGGDITEGKRAATTVARAAEMGADTKIKQEILSDLDADKLERGPRWWKGDDRYTYGEGPMGADDRAQMTKHLNNKVYHGVMEDLDGILGEEKSYEVLKDLSTFSGNRRGYNNDPDAFIQAIKEELEFRDVKYDMTFWENYVNEIMQLTTPEVPMFKYGGLV